MKRRFTVPALPGCITEGETLREARKMVVEAIQACCESMLKDGLALPESVAAPVLETMDVEVGAP